MIAYYLEKATAHYVDVLRECHTDEFYNTYMGENGMDMDHYSDTELENACADYVEARLAEQGISCDY